MLFMQPWMALVALALFIPQVFFIPVLQEAINRRTARAHQDGARAGGRHRRQGEGRGRASARRPTEPRRRRLPAEHADLPAQVRHDFLMNLLYQLGVIGILAVGGWLLLRGETEVGTVVAFISGLARTNDPWNDLVDYFRNLTNAGVKYALIAQVLEKGGKRSSERERSERSARHRARRRRPLCLTCLRRPPYLAATAPGHRAARGGVAQLVRVPACHAGGRGFEPRHSRHSFEWTHAAIARSKVAIARAVEAIRLPYTRICADFERGRRRRIAPHLPVRSIIRLIERRWAIPRGSRHDAVRESPNGSRRSSWLCHCRRRRDRPWKSCPIGTFR